MSIADSSASYPVERSETLLETPIFDVVSQRVRLDPEEEAVERVFVKHLSAVAVVAVDDQDRVLLISQYRHPVGMRLWEIPAGLLDVDGETLQSTAARELYEEADMQAKTWHTLVDFYTTPGAHNEAIRIFLAENVSDIPAAQRHERVHEEASIERVWVPLQEAVAAILEGRIHNPSAIQGILALYAVRNSHTAPRAVTDPWLDHPRGITV